MKKLCVSNLGAGGQSVSTCAHAVKTSHGAGQYIDSTLLVERRRRSLPVLFFHLRFFVNTLACPILFNVSRVCCDPYSCDLSSASLYAEVAYTEA